MPKLFMPELYIKELFMELLHERFLFIHAQTILSHADILMPKLLLDKL